MQVVDKLMMLGVEEQAKALHAGDIEAQASADQVTEEHRADAVRAGAQDDSLDQILFALLHHSRSH